MIDNNFEFNRQIDNSDIGFVDKLGYAARDTSFIGSTINAISNMYDDSGFKQEDVTDDEIKEVIDIYGIDEKRQRTFLERAKNVRNHQHLHELTQEYLEEQRLERAVDNSALGGIGYYGLGAMTDVLPALGAAKATNLTFNLARQTATANKFRLGLSGTAYETALVYGLNQTSERDRTVLEDALQIGLGGVSSAVFGRSLYQSAKKKEEYVTNTIKMTTGLKDKDIEQLHKANYSNDTKKVEQILNKGLEHKNSQQLKTVTEQLEDIKKTLTTPSKVYETFQFNISYLGKQSPSETFAFTSEVVFHDPTLATNKLGVQYSNIKAAHITNSLKTGATGHWKETHNKFYNMLVEQE